MERKFGSSNAVTGKQFVCETFGALNRLLFLPVFGFNNKLLKKLKLFPAQNKEVG